MIFRKSRNRNRRRKKPSYIKTDPLQVKVQRDSRVSLFSILVVILIGGALYLQHSFLFKQGERTLELFNYLFSVSDRLILSVGLILLASWGLQKSSSDYFVNRFRTTLPFLFSMTFLGTNPYCYAYPQLPLGALIAVFVFRFVFSFGDREIGLEKMFLFTILISMGSVFIPQLIVVIPIVLLYFMFIGKFNLRLLMIALVGVMIPYFIYFSVLTFLNQELTIVEEFSSAFALRDLKAYDWEFSAMLYSMIIILFLLICSLPLLLNVSSTDKILHRNQNGFVFLFVLGISVVFFLCNDISLFLLGMAFSGAGMVTGHYFTMHINRWTKFMFFVSFISLLAVGAYIVLQNQFL